MFESNKHSSTDHVIVSMSRTYALLLEQYIRGSSFTSTKRKWKATETPLYTASKPVGTKLNYLPPKPLEANKLHSILNYG